MIRNLQSGQDAILITGPTASGKSALALDFARHHGGVVVNADSMQVYDTLRVLTARPSQDDMAGVPHLLYGHVPPSQTYSTGIWQREVTQVLETLRGQGTLPVIVGGTGLYFKALTGGLSQMPEVPDAIRHELRTRLQAQGAEALHATLARVDPQTAAVLKPGDGQRVLRALEVFQTSGRSIRDFQAERGPMLLDPARALKIVVQPDRTLLRSRIDARFAAMLDLGAVEEVRTLLAQALGPELPAMRAIGVKQIASMLSGTISRAEVIETAAAATRQYAKRQMTWFRNQLDDDWQRWDPASGPLISG